MKKPPVAWKCEIWSQCSYGFSTFGDPLMHAIQELCASKGYHFYHYPLHTADFDSTCIIAKPRGYTPIAKTIMKQSLSDRRRQRKRKLRSF